jgi:predicted nucleotidyltransferase
VTKTIQTKHAVIETLRANEDTIRSYGVRRLGIFGSVAREEHNSESDVDLLVEFQKGSKTFDNFINLVFFLEELLGRKVELITTDSLSPYIGPRILEEVEYVP